VERGRYETLGFHVGATLTCAADAAQVSFIKIDGAIGPATATYIARAIDVAAARKTNVLIIHSTRRADCSNPPAHRPVVLHSPVPTVVFVAPAPAHAASAGTFITLAADVAAMAPHTRSRGAPGIHRRGRRRGKNR